MSLDPIADLLTKIRNAFSAQRRDVYVRASKMNKSLLEIMKKTKYISDFSEAEQDGKKVFHIKLNTSLPMLNLKRVSTPGQRIYNSYSDLKPVMNGYGVGIISTSSGVMTFKEAKGKKLGGEVLAYIW